jgi:hypothetical protein
MKTQINILTTGQNIQSDANSFADRQLLNTGPGDRGACIYTVKN